MRVWGPRRGRWRWSIWWHAEDGRVSAFLVAMVVGILAVAGLTLDGGLALAAKVEATGQAQAAARAGAQALDLAVYRADESLRLMPGQAADAARTYLAAIGATGTVTVAGNAVTVTVTRTRPTQLLGLVGIRSLTVTGTGSAQPRRGVTGVEP